MCVSSKGARDIVNDDDDDDDDDDDVNVTSPGCLAVVPKLQIGRRLSCSSKAHCELLRVEHATLALDQGSIDSGDLSVQRL